MSLARKLCTFLIILSLSFNMVYSLNYNSGIDSEADKPATILFFDLAIPGYGMFSQNKPYWGLTYAGLKLAGAFLIFSAVRNHDFWASASNSANIVQANDPGLVLFKNPNDSSQSFTARELQNKADGSFLFVIYAISFELLVFTVSGWHSYETAFEKEKSNGPFYKMANNTSGTNISAGWQLQF